jgi:hypothetical protein
MVWARFWTIVPQLCPAYFSVVAPTFEYVGSFVGIETIVITSVSIIGIENPKIYVIRKRQAFCFLITTRERSEEWKF